jgi:arylsulfatase A-like enzyme
LLGSRTDQTIDTVDLAPTLLHLAGLEKPVHMQGHNIVSALVEHAKNYNYLYRGRMDERIDLVRAITLATHSNAKK